MRKKLEGNGLWESSRMMLPEHKEQILKANQELTTQEKPILDAQKWEQINELLNRASHGSPEVRVTVFGRRQNRSVIGKINKIDTLTNRIYIQNEWIKFSNVIDVVEV